MLEVAFEKTPEHKILARSVGVSPRTIVRVKSYVAHACLERQLAQLQSLAAAFAQEKPAWCVFSLMWGETPQRLSLAVLGDSARHGSQSTWEVLVLRAQLLWVARNSVKVVSLALPPVPLVSTKAERMYAGLFNHPITQPVMQLCTSMLQQAVVAARAHEADGHPASDRTRALIQGREHDVALDKGHFPIVCEKLACGNHTTNLVIVRLLTVVLPVELLNSMYSLSLFLRMGGHFLRIVACARQLIRDPACFTWSEDGAMAVPAGFFWQELRDLLCDNYARGADEARACEGQSTHSEAG